VKLLSQGCQSGRRAESRVRGWSGTGSVQRGRVWDQRRWKADLFEDEKRTFPRFRRNRKPYPGVV